MKLRKADQILIIKGKDKGKKAKILRSFPKENKILAEGINIKKVHKKPKKEGEKGQVVEVPFSFPSSKAKLICPKCNKPSKIGYKIEGGKKLRVCKKCQAEI